LAGVAVAAMLVGVGLVAPRATLSTAAAGKVLRVEIAEVGAASASTTNTSVPMG